MHRSLQLDRDMDEAIRVCSGELMEDLPSTLKITSVSTRLTNLQVEAEKLLAGTRSADHSKKKKTKLKRSESVSATEVSVTQALTNLQCKFAEYKSSVETRRISPSPGPKSPKPEIQPAVRQRAVTLEARSRQEVTSPKRRTTVTKTSPPGSPSRKAQEAKSQSAVTSPSHRPKAVQTSPSVPQLELPGPSRKTEAPSSVTSPSRKPAGHASPKRRATEPRLEPVVPNRSQRPEQTQAQPSVTSPSRKPTRQAVLTASPKRRATEPRLEPAIPRVEVSDRSQKPEQTQVQPSVTSPSRKPTGQALLTASPKRRATEPRLEPAQETLKAPKLNSKQKTELKQLSSRLSSQQQLQPKWQGKVKERAAAYLEKANKERGEAEPITLKRGSASISAMSTEKMSRDRALERISSRSPEKIQTSREQDLERITSKPPEKTNKEQGSEQTSSKPTEKPSAKVALEPKHPEKQTAQKQLTSKDTAKKPAKENPKASTELEIMKPATNEPEKKVVTTSAVKDVDPDFEQPRRRRLSSSSSYIIPSAGEPQPKERTYTAPTICRAAIRHIAPIKQVSLITINVSSKKQGEETAAAPKVSKTITISPTTKNPPSSLGSFVSTGKKPLQTVSKVSSLRDMFNKKDDTDSSRAGSKSPDVRAKSKSKSPSPPLRRFRSPDIAPIEETMSISRAEEESRLSEPARRSGKTSVSAKPQLVGKASKSVVAVREHELARPLRPSPPRMTPEHPPPRPPSPIAYYLEAMSDSSDLEFDSDVINGSYSDASISSNGEEVDYPGIGTLKEKRVLKSLK